MSQPLNKDLFHGKKAWGKFWTRHIDRRTWLVEAHIIEGGYSSPHLHEGMANQFIVVSGRLQLTLFGKACSRQSTFEHELRRFLSPGSQPITIPAGVKHQFFAVTPVVLYELYTAAVGHSIDPQDIRRFGERGVRRLVADAS